jgi:hypothetical protein
MVRSWLAGMLALALVACGGGDKDKQEGPSGAQGPSTSSPPKPSGPIKATPVTADLAMLPADAELVVGAHVAQLVKSDVYKQLIEPMLASNELAGKLAELKTKCGLDPLASVERLAAGVKGFGKGVKPEGVIVVHGLDKEKTLACVDSEAKAKAEVTRDGDAMVVKTQRGDIVAFQFTSATDAVVVFGPSAGAAALKKAIGATGELKSAPAFVELFNQIETSHTAWVVMNGTSKAFGVLESLGMQAKALYGSANATDGVTVDLRMRLASGDQAMRLATLANQQSKTITSVLSFDKLEIANDGDDLKLAVGVTGAKLPTVVKQIQNLLAGGLGRMGMGSP